VQEREEEGKALTSFIKRIYSAEQNPASYDLNYQSLPCHNNLGFSERLLGIETFPFTFDEQDDRNQRKSDDAATAFKNGFGQAAFCGLRRLTSSIPNPHTNIECQR